MSGTVNNASVAVLKLEYDNLNAEFTSSEAYYAINMDPVLE